MQPQKRLHFYTWDIVSFPINFICCYHGDVVASSFLPAIIQSPIPPFNTPDSPFRHPPFHSSIVSDYRGPPFHTLPFPIPQLHSPLFPVFQFQQVQNPQFFIFRNSPKVQRGCSLLGSRTCFRLYLRFFRLLTVATVVRCVTSGSDTSGFVHMSRDIP